MVDDALGGSIGSEQQVIALVTLTVLVDLFQYLLWTSKLLSEGVNKNEGKNSADHDFVVDQQPHFGSLWGK